jgi:putative transposase
MTSKRRKKHTPDQIVAKLRDGDAMLNAGKDLTAVLQSLEISEATLSSWWAQYDVMKPEEAQRSLSRDAEADSRASNAMTSISSTNPSRYAPNNPLPPYARERPPRARVQPPEANPSPDQQTSRRSDRPPPSDRRPLRHASRLAPRPRPLQRGICLGST